MKVYLVNRTDQHEEGGNSYETETTVAASLYRNRAETLANRGGWSVQEMELDTVFFDSWLCRIGFDGREVGCWGPTPVSELPEDGPDPCKTGCTGVGWTAKEARDRARLCYDQEIKEGFEKLSKEIEERKRLLGIK